MANDRNPLADGFFAVFAVPSRRTVSEWADEFRILPSKGAAEPGPYRSARTPYMREPMDSLSATSMVQEVSLMAAAQTGKSESGNNWVGYVIDDAPGPMLLVQPTVDNAKRYSKQRISPMILECPTLRTKVADNKSRDSGNNMLEKEFPGGILLLGGANSAAGLRSMPIKYLFADEISNWPESVDGEGDPLALAIERTNTFARRKIFKCSTPSIKGTCRIEAEYLATDQRKYYVPCPHCGHYHVLEWKNFVIPKGENGKPRPNDAYMACPECGGIIEEHQKTDMLAAGQWRATCPENADPLKVGYHISALYSPVGWKSWAAIAKQWIKAQGNPELLKAFVNNVLAETWKDAGGSRADEHALMARAEDYDTSPLPAGAVLLTAGIDVQLNRIELEIVGWGRGEESWSVDYVVIHGDTQAPAIWNELDAQLLRIYQHPAGVQMQVARACIDTGGTEGMTQWTYNYVKSRFGRVPVLATKGQPGEGKPVIGPPTRTNLAKLELYPIGTFTAKDMVFGRLQIEEPGPGYMHFPKRYEESYYKMLTAEEVRVKTNQKGFPVREWHKIGDRRNEALDCRVGATAALYSMNLDIDQLADMFEGKTPPPQQKSGRGVRGELETA